MKRSLVILAALSALMTLPESAEAQWVETGGPGGTSIQALTVIGNNLYAGTAGSIDKGIFLSTDSGISWTPVNNGLTNLGVRELICNGSVLFCGTYGGGVFRSPDSGANWTAVNNGLASLNIRSLAARGSVLYAGTWESGIFRSPDSGANWTAVSNGLTNLYVDALAFCGTDFYAGTNGGLFRSSDSAASWNVVSSIPVVGINSIVVNSGNLFVGTQGLGLYRSTDSGISWGLTMLGGAIYSIAASDFYVFSSVYQQIYFSRDNGAKWYYESIGSRSVICFIVSGNNVFAGTTDGFVLRWRLNVSQLIQYTPNPTYNRRPQFNWYSNIYSPVYKIQIDTTQQFISPIISTTTTDTFYMPINNLPFDTIYWRIGDEADPDAWSTVSSVRIVRAIPTLIPYTPNPTNNRRPQLSWYRHDSISTFRIQIDTTQQLIYPLVSTTATDTFYSPPMDLPYDTIYWRVGNDADSLAWSGIFSVRIVGYPPSLIAYTPDPTYNRRPQFLWNKNDSISLFRIQLDTNQSFASPIFSQTLTDTFFTPATDLPFDTIYWRVGNEADPMAWSSVSSVRIVRGVPTLIAYTPNPTPNRRPQLQWYHHDSIFVYRIQIHSTQQFASPMITDSTSDTLYLPLIDLPFTTNYWRVRNNGDSLAPWSEVSSFAVYDSVSNFGRWVRTSGPPSTEGAINSLAVNGGTIFAGTTSGGVYVTSDNGTTWTASNSGLTNYYIRSLTICGGSIVAGTNSGGVFRSIDNGTTWAASNSGLTDTSRILSVSADDDTVFASVYPGGVFRSDNNGINWTVVTQGFSPAVVLVSNGYVIAATGGGFGGCSNSEGLSATQIYHSSDNGVSWQGVLVQPSRCVFTASSSCWYQCYFSGFLSLAANDTTVFAGKETYNIAFSPPMTVPGGVVFRSLNNGISWNAVVNFGITTSVRSLYVKNGYIYAGVEPRGVHCSADNGSSWTVMNSGLTDTSIYSLAANTDYLFAGTRSHGVWRWLLSKTPTSIKQQQAHIAGREILKLIPRNRSLTVSFSLPRRENVKLNVFDLSGHLVATLCDKTMQAGQHAVSWDTRSLASGCYIVRLQADATTQVKSVPLFR